MKITAVEALDLQPSHVPAAAAAAGDYSRIAASSSKRQMQSCFLLKCS
jgi:hypothetical protein